MAHANIVAAFFDSGVRVSASAINALPGDGEVEQDPNVVRLFLDHGLDPNAAQSNGEPILSYESTLLIKG